MAHELTMTNGKAEMAFVGETPWHGLGQELNQDASFDEWQVAAGMDWSIQSSPVLFNAENTNNDSVELFTGKNVLYRSDNNAPLSVVTNRYKVVQPVEVLHFFKSLVEENGFKLHTAGTLFGGKRMWALAETGNFGEVSKNDGVGGFLLLSTSCDKSIATTARFTTVRVVCNNTLSMSINDNSNMVSFSHLQKFDHEAVKAKLANSVAAFGSFMEMAKLLRKQRLGGSNAVEFVRKLLLTNDQLLDNEYPYDKNRAFSKIMDLFEGDAKGSELVEDSKWGMLNAVTEYYDHHATGRTRDSKLNSTWFGEGNKVKNRAVELLLA
jgi:phage/plasmid-like protein (TIGR03299 family)